MLLKNNIAAVFRLFMKNPVKEFHLRELSRASGLSTTAVSSALDALHKRNILTKREVGIYDMFTANTKEKKFIAMKKAMKILERID